MKKILAALAVFLAAGAFAHGQLLTPQPGYTTQTLFSVPYSAGSGFGFDSSGNIFFMGADAEAQGASEQDQVIEETASSGYTSSQVLVQYASPTFGSFVTVQSGTVYYGDGIYGGPGNVNATSVSPVNPPVAPNPIASMPGNYDLDFSGTTAYVSANILGGDNEVYALNVTTGQYSAILDTGSDYSGPLAFTSSGDLVYGGAGAVYDSGTYEGGIPNIYVFSAASVQESSTSGIPLQISDAELVIDDSGNAGFAMGPNNELYQVYAPINGAATVSGIDLETGSSTLIATLGNTDAYYFDGINYYDGSITVATTDGGSFTDFIQITPVPEPGVASLGIGSLAIAAILCRRRSRRRIP
jgi:hypothetical protein